jgi:GH24 family phage-related lysozyme (muramidase)
MRIIITENQKKKLFRNGIFVRDIPLTESKTPSFLLKEEMVLINEGNIQNYVNNIVSKIKHLPYNVKKKYITIAISTLLGYTSYPIIQSMFNNVSDNDVKEIINNTTKKKKTIKLKDPRFKYPTKMRLSNKGWTHIKNEETVQLKAYSIGDGMITIGYGHAEPIKTSNITVGQEISKEFADSLLKRDLKWAADGVRRIFKDFKKQGIDVSITQDMFDALVSMAFNSGVGGLKKTEVIRQIKNNNLKRAGELIRNTNINKKFPGLNKRRDKESDMFLSYLNKTNNIKA